MPLVDVWWCTVHDSQQVEGSHHCLLAQLALGTARCQPVAAKLGIAAEAAPAVTEAGLREAYGEVLEASRYRRPGMPLECRCPSDVCPRHCLGCTCSLDAPGCCGHCVVHQDEDCAARDATPEALARGPWYCAGCGANLVGGPDTGWQHVGPQGRTVDAPHRALARAWDRP